MEARFRMPPTQSNGAIAQIRASLAHNRNSEEQEACERLPRKLLPWALCFTAGVWLVFAVVEFAPDQARYAMQQMHATIAAWTTPAPLATAAEAPPQEPQPIAVWHEEYAGDDTGVPLIPPLPENCNQARAMGLAPAYAGNPGYAPWLDGDHDGVSCEPIPVRKRHYR